MTRRETALLHAQLARFARKLAQARERVRIALASVPSAYIAMSGGKDSSVVLFLVREHAPETVAVNSRPQWILPETKVLFDATLNLVFVSRDSDHRTGWAKNWPSREAAEAEGVVWLTEKADILRRGRSEAGVFLGLRAEENSYRRLYFHTCGWMHHAKATGKWHINPIYDWSVWDVWAAIYSLQIPYNRAYDVMEQIGVDVHHQRIGPFAVEKVLGYGPLAILKRGWPSVFNAYAAEHPEASAYV